MIDRRHAQSFHHAPSSSILLRHRKIFANADLGLCKTDDNARHPTVLIELLLHDAPVLGYVVLTNASADGMDELASIPGVRHIEQSRERHILDSKSMDASEGCRLRRRLEETCPQGIDLVNVTQL